MSLWDLIKIITHPSAISAIKEIIELINGIIDRIEELINLIQGEKEKES